MDKFGKQWTSRNGYFWDLPSAGTYTLIALLRPRIEDQGMLKGKLTVHAEKSAAGAGLLVPDAGGDKYGASTRGVAGWRQKRWSYVGNPAMMEWQVEVTGAIRVGLSGKQQASNRNQYFQSDGGGYAAMYWHKMAGEEVTLI